MRNIGGPFSLGGDSDHPHTLTQLLRWPENSAERDDRPQLASKTSRLPVEGL
jgi:hypothetical protein